MEEIDKNVKVELNLKQFLSDIKKRQNAIEGEFVITSSNKHKREVQIIDT